MVKALYSLPREIDYVSQNVQLKSVVSEISATKQTFQLYNINNTFSGRFHRLTGSPFNLVSGNCIPLHSVNTIPSWHFYDIGWLVSRQSVYHFHLKKQKHFRNEVSSSYPQRFHVSQSTVLEISEIKYAARSLVRSLHPVSTALNRIVLLHNTLNVSCIWQECLRRNASNPATMYVYPISSEKWLYQIS